MLHVHYLLLLNINAPPACSPYCTDGALGCTKRSLRCTLARYLLSPPRPGWERGKANLMQGHESAF